jgi:hypothetical protein
MKRRVGFLKEEYFRCTELRIKDFAAYFQLLAILKQPSQLYLTM